jgi:pyruvate,water dikinase
MHAPSHAYVVPLDALSLDDLPRVGGKNASLGEMIRALRGAGVRVPGGFAITTDAYREHLHRNHLEAPIRDALDGLDATDTRALSCAGHSIRHMIRGAPLPADVRAEVMTAYAALADAEVGPLDVAVRSSATAEDLPTASFAGQQDSFLFVHGEDELDTAVRSCMASLFTDRAIVYRREHGIPDHGVALSVGVQQMVRSDLASAGVMFTLDTESGSPDVVTISGAWGLGELLVQGRVDPD